MTSYTATVSHAGRVKDLVRIEGSGIQIPLSSTEFNG